MGALPANVRRVVTVQGETPFLGAWAFGVPYDPAVILASELYELVSSRGINPFDDQVERLAPPKATETIGESSGATPTAPPDDSTVNNDSTTE
jgi:hypothetical protein